MAVAGPGATIVGITAGRIVVNTAISAADLITEFSAGAKVYLERDTTSAFASPTVVTSTALASGTEQYEFVDTTGTASSWYRVRVGNTGGTLYTDYSDGVQATQVLAYATLDDVLRGGNFGSDVSKHPYLSSLLITAKELIDERCGRSFTRNPQVSGTGTWTFAVRYRGKRRLSLALGYGLDIVSITTLEIADYDGASYNTVASGDTGYWLVDNDGPTSDWPYQDVVLADSPSQYATFPAGQGATLRITGVRGFTRIPELVRQASVDMVREWFRQGPQGGVQAGVTPYGAPIFTNGEPHTFRQLYRIGSPYVKQSYASI